MKVAIFLIFILFRSIAAFSQVKGKVITVKGEPVASANIIVHKAIDSTRVTGGSSDSIGSFQFNSLSAGDYYFRFSSIGYLTAYSNVFTIATDNAIITLPPVLLTKEEAALGEVIVRAKKEMVKFIPGGKAFNVQASLATKGSNALQVLERLPGVITDRRNNQFTLNGQTGVTILFNGRRVNLSMDELMNLLESTVADNIEKIELITSPTAKYDADGGAGIINIVFKKSEQEGTRINTSATIGYGYREKAVASLSLSQGFKKANLNASYSYMHDVRRSGFRGTGTNDNLVYTGSTFSTFSGMSRSYQNTHNLNLSGEIRPGTGNTFGGDIVFSVSGTRNLTDNAGSWEYDNGEYLGYAALSQGKPKRHNVIASVYSRHKLSGKSQLNMDASYINYVNNSPAIINSRYFDRNGNKIEPADSNFTSGNRGESVSNIRAVTFSMDYSTQLDNKLQAEFGAKASYSENSNNSKVERMVNNGWQTDPRSQSAVFSNEKIGAAYMQFIYSINKQSSLQTGLRYEYWRRDININKSSFVISKFFPSFLYTYNFENNSTVSFNYTRRITRPSYSDLISNLFYNDPTFIFSGNPLLKPTLTDVVKAEFNRKKLNTGLSFQYDLYPVLRYQITSNETKEIGISSPQNLDYQKSINLFINYSFQLATWWKIAAGSTTSLRNYKVSYSLQPAEKTYIFQTLNSTQNIQLPRNFEVELAGWYNFPYYEGTNSLRGFGVVNLGIAKKLKDDKGTFQLSFPDLFRSFSVHTHISGMTPIAFNINSRSNWRDETSLYQVFRFTYSRSFGKSSIRSVNKSSRNEEAERIQ